MTIYCPHPRPKLNMPGYSAPRLPWQAPTFLPQSSLADLSRALTEQFRGIYAVLQQLGQRRTVVPLIEDIDARKGQVIVGVGAGQTIRLPEGITGELGQVGIVLTDVTSPVLTSGGLTAFTSGTAFTVTAATLFRVTTNTVERLEITADGAYQVNGSAGTAGQTLTSNGSAAAPSWSDGYRILGFTALTGSGTYAPAANVRAFIVEICGGGGGGGGADNGSAGNSAAGSGGGGGQWKRFFVVVPSPGVTTYAYAQGSGGASAGAQGGAGGGGAAATNTTGAVGGVGGSGFIRIWELA